MSLLKIITPINLAEEEEKFFRSSSYHPTFKYNWDLPEISEWLVKKPKYEALISAMINQDTEKITHNAEVMFESPWDESVYHQAVTTLEIKATDIAKPTLDELVKAQEKWLHSFGIDYSVKVVDVHGFVARPIHKLKELQISRYVEFYFFSLESSIRHDAVHLIRYLNGLYNQIPRSTGYLPTEEGLATYMQDFGGLEPNNSAFQHAAEYTVTKVCRHGPLREAVDYLNSIGFPKKLAWQRAVRHKFGFVDSSKPGDIMKPAMYFAHSLKVKSLSPDEQLRLLVGKISLDDLSQHHHYLGRWSKEKLTELFIF